MQRLSRFVIWVCAKFTKEQIKFIVKELNKILENRDPAIKPKDDFQEKHPNYRKFFVDATPPLTQSPIAKKKPK
jgi:hypothetical protein